MGAFRAYVLERQEDGQTSFSLKQLEKEALPEGEVVVRVAYSSVNYKDGMIAISNQMVKSYPHIPGIDLAGTVEQSSDPRFREGDAVIVTSYGLGVSQHGGFSELARVPADWVVPLPEGLSLKEAMILGTAGFTAALSVQRLEDNGLHPGKGPVLVAGATGGVGSVAVDLLAGRGYEVTASTGKAEEHAYLRELGAANIIGREELADIGHKPLRKGLWAGAVDPVGGQTLQYILSTMMYGGSVATSGLTGGHEVATTVYPFILRGVNWLGIDSVECPMELRRLVWNRLATDLKPKHLGGSLVNEIRLEQLPEVLQNILQGKVRGRTIVAM
ncbi:acrylyl-CoA reductase family protein [Paenibacillus radicis (ex Gao et al. 2016)]|uniref:Quinone oxidoreductase YhfP n=1 Tax=Paenibacillus radicis (ex Gao et al. 2016) TaxID=1737354 RepID=A0A917GZN3_9BACL|nr:acryloyl-CoA reductase [Paenibacillus radicis (ex Gao et al. 2016)]GGG62777.1 putative quinone oxidoreductase YhfP [Paenibacillus radicis (ex Gao et al. 2016)]